MRSALDTCRSKPRHLLAKRFGDDVAPFRTFEEAVVSVWLNGKCE